MGEAIAERPVAAAAKAQLRTNADELIAPGGFGLPTIFLEDDMCFGKHRLPLVRAAVLRGLG